MANATNKRQSHGLTLPQSSNRHDSVVSNILSSLATLDETAQLQWIQETSRQVDNERAFQRRENGLTNGTSGIRYERYDSDQDESLQAPVTGVGYRDRGRTGSYSVAAPSPAVPMGRGSKQGFFRRFMGIGPKISLEGDLLIATHQPKPSVLVKSTSSVRETREPVRAPPPQPIPEESRPNLVKKKSSNFFRRRPKSSGDGVTKAPTAFSHHEPPPPLPKIITSVAYSGQRSNSDIPIIDLRHNLESFHLSNGPAAPRPTSPHLSQEEPRLPPRKQYRPDVSEHRDFLTRDNRLDSDASQVSEVFEIGLNHAASSTVSSESDVRFIGKSPQPDKAKLVMGLQTSKPLSSRKFIGDDNFTTLEREHADLRTPTRPKVQEPMKANGVDDYTSMDEDRVKETARDIYYGTELLVSMNEAAKWLMNPNEFNTKVRTAYMELYDFLGSDVLTAVRRVCQRLLLKGESQQLDRILQSLAKRWFECNPENGMKHIDVVHALCYSIFLLNTDLHIVDVASSQRMTRHQFVRNTMSTILSQLPAEKRLSTVPIRTQTTPLPRGKLTTFPSTSSPNLSHSATASNLSRSGSLLKVSQAIGMARNGSAQSLDHGTGRPSRESSRTANQAERVSWSLFDDKVGPFGGMAAMGSHSAWEAQMECEIYTSLKQTPLEQAQSTMANDSNDLRVGGLGLTRSASMMSQMSHASDTGSAMTRNTIKNMVNRDFFGRHKSQTRLQTQDSHLSIKSTPSSTEDRAKSPPNSSSKHKRSLSHGRSPSLRSVESFNFGDRGASIGFANSLTQIVIREEGFLNHATFIDEELQEHALILSGPPWAKEGVLKSKRHIDSNLKKAKEKGWTESFVVIDKGQMRLFQFDSRRTNNAMQVGGGNWQQNAHLIGSFLLRQTLASALPAPGYSRQRQHVWALTLPSGSVFFFEAGTAELVKEWVESANYWTARTSKEPLRAGVSNMEWGWGDCLAISEDEATDDEASVADSRRSTFEAQRSPTINGKATYGGESRVLKGDKAIIREWKEPQQSLMPSSLKEKDQLKTLEQYISHLEEEFSQHNDIRPLMLRSFSPRHPNSVRAGANWERKSQYMLREIVKYKTYVEVLSRALVKREELISNSVKTPRVNEPPPEPWLDAASSATTSVSTMHTGVTKDIRNERGDLCPVE